MGRSSQCGDKQGLEAGKMLGGDEVVTKLSLFKTQHSDLAAKPPVYKTLQLTHQYSDLAGQPPVYKTLQLTHQYSDLAAKPPVYKTLQLTHQYSDLAGEPPVYKTLQLTHQTCIVEAKTAHTFGNSVETQIRCLVVTAQPVVSCKNGFCCFAETYMEERAPKGYSTGENPATSCILLPKGNGTAPGGPTPLQQQRAWCWICRGEKTDKDSAPKDSTATAAAKTPGGREKRADFRHVISQRLPSALKHPAGRVYDLFPLVTVDGCVRASRVMGKA
ncbi:hypothetical protein E5288_WYG022706 [Bos mutus]|uniref:Uncharacterized protein n=1 Tax=Bos mutus TaxID=72004 RepID=A0A6B0QYZ8_9CETA|nr:hypothetical protein [Bos mutus]